MIKPDQEQLLTNLVIAEDLVEKAKNYLRKGTINIKDYNDALKYASKFIRTVAKKLGFSKLR